MAQNLDQSTTREREIRTLVDAMRVLNLSSGLILTDSNAGPIQVNGFTIEIRSIAEWLLQGE